MLFSKFLKIISKFLKMLFCYSETVFDDFIKNVA